MHFFTEKNIEREEGIPDRQCCCTRKRSYFPMEWWCPFFFNPSELDVGDWNCCSRCIPFTEQLIPSGEKKEKI